MKLTYRLFQWHRPNVWVGQCDIRDPRLIKQNHIVLEYTL